MHPLRTLLHEYEWIHTGIGIAGNLAFAVGSVLFLTDATMRVGVWFFIIGSFGMLIGSLGSAFVKGIREGNVAGNAPRRRT